MDDGCGSLADLREYYAAHASDFKAEDKVKWQDLYVEKERFKTADEARKYATSLSNRAARGEDFIKLVADHGMGDTKLRDGAGVGEKPGKVKILFGNMSDKDAEITIGGKKVKVPAGAGSQGPDGPSLELKPGQLTASMKGAKESFKADADTIWMVGIGPGGLIVVQQ